MRETVGTLCVCRQPRCVRIADNRRNVQSCVYSHTWQALEAGGGGRPDEVHFPLAVALFLGHLEAPGICGVGGSLEVEVHGELLYDAQRVEHLESRAAVAELVACVAWQRFVSARTPAQ